MKISLRKYTIFFSIILFLLTFAVYIYIFYLARITLINGIRPIEKESVMNQIFITKENKNKVVYFGGNGTKTEVDLNQITHTKRKIFEDHLLSGIFDINERYVSYVSENFIYNGKESTLNVLSNDGSSMVFPINNIKISPKEFKLMSINDIYEICLSWPSMGIGTMDEFLTDILHFLYTKIPVKFRATTGHIWLSTPESTKIYMMSKDNLLVAFMYNFINNNVSNATETFSGTLKNRKLTVYIDKYLLFYVEFPVEIKDKFEHPITAKIENLLMTLQFTRAIKDKQLEAEFNKIFSNRLFYLKKLYNYFIRSNYVNEQIRIAQINARRQYMQKLLEPNQIYEIRPFVKIHRINYNDIEI